MPGGSAVPLRTDVVQALGIPATDAVHLLTTAIFFMRTETDNDSRANAAEILGRVLWTWNPHVRGAFAIRQDGAAPGHERRSRQNVQGFFSASLRIEAIIGHSDDMHLNRWTKDLSREAYNLVFTRGHRRGPADGIISYPVKMDAAVFDL
jgi:hypothetical protein